MFENMENLKIMSAFYGVSNVHKFFTNRPCHALIFKKSGESIYTFGNKKILLSEHEVIFIPQGSNYLIERLCDTESMYALINFTADIKNASAQKFKSSNIPETADTYDKLIKMWLFRNSANHYECISLFYKILSLLCEDDKNYYDVQKHRTIEPAIKYLEKHIFDSSLKTSELHTLCGVSDTYFRKIFIGQFGISPKQYITGKRLMQAKNMLDSGAYKYVYEVSEAVGFSDSLYFSRIFKKHYGYFPSRLSERQ